MKNTITPLVILFLLFSISSCKKDCEEKLDTSKINIEVKVERLESEYKTIKTPEDALNFLTNHSLFTYFNLEAGKPKEVLLKEVLWLGSAPLDSLLLDVNTQFGDFEAEKTNFTELFKNVKFFYSDFETPEVNTIVSGFGGYILDDMDSLMIIGLDYFLDTNARYLPPRDEIPDYIKRHLTKNNIDTKAAFALSNRYLEFSPDQKLINQMIKYGKQYYFMRQVLPCKAENEILDYTEEEWKEIKANEYTVYSYFSKNELFYNSRGENYRLFVGDRPNCVEIGDECPGRIGRWLGYEIVKAYAEKTGVSLPQIMSEKDHVKIFTNAGYKPEKP